MTGPEANTSPNELDAPSIRMAKNMLCVRGKIVTRVQGIAKLVAELTPEIFDVHMTEEATLDTEGLSQRVAQLQAYYVHTVYKNILRVVQRLDSEGRRPGTCLVRTRYMEMVSRYSTHCGAPSYATATKARNVPTPPIRHILPRLPSQAGN